MSEREGLKWGFISGVSNIITLLIGYILFACRKRIACSGRTFIRVFGYWTMFIFLLFDPINLSIMPFVFGGDVGGIAEGFGLNRYLVQTVFFAILLINREILIHKVFPLFNVKNKHPLFRPILKERV